MLGLGLTEILLVGAVMLVVVGPDRLPQVFRTLGRIYGQIRRASDEMRRAFVLEADRQDADERFEKLQERRKAALAARKAALDAAGGNSVPVDDGPEPQTEAEPAEASSDGASPDIEAPRGE